MYVFPMTRKKFVSIFVFPITFSYYEYKYQTVFYLPYNIYVVNNAEYAMHENTSLHITYLGMHCFILELR